MKLHLVQRTHKYGNDVYNFLSPQIVKELTTEELEALDIDFDPERGETLSFVWMELADIPTFRA